MVKYHEKKVRIPIESAVNSEGDQDSLDDNETVLCEPLCTSH